MPDQLQSKNGKDLIFAVLRHEQVDRIPWVPFAGVHAGKLKGYDSIEVLQDAKKLVESLLEVKKVYGPDGMPVVFDLQLEAEILGCELLWSAGNPPSVASHPLASNMEIPTHIPTAQDGRLPIVLQAMREMKAQVGDTTALYGLITGPMTLASHLRGTEIFMDTFDHEEFLQELLDYCRKVAEAMAKMFIEAGMDVIAVVDPVVSQVSASHFRQFLSKPFRDIFATIRARGAFSSFFVCGDATRNIEVMCLTKPDSIAVDENVNLLKAKKITDAHNIAIGGNIPLTTRMLLGNQNDNMQFVVEMLAELGEGENMTPQNFILSPGCDMPYDTPIENVVGVLQAVRDPIGTRKMLEHYQTSSFDIEIDLPDYPNLKVPLVEVFTLDSDTCAACTYMMQAARRAKDEIGDGMELVEYKFNTRENVARVMKMGVKNLPSLLVNGELKYSSLIPGQKELVQTILAEQK